ncbi:MAG: polymer-forming cytoskeletal protein [Ktedonobacteraceae bacterium]|nr:polymer-forming cytoskeletal protein [Ktedonobacteraceae bacterium]
MQTGRKIRRFMLTLPGICQLLAIAVLIIGGGGQFISGSSTALAKGSQREAPVRDCTEDHQKPSFGSTVVVSSGEVVCGSLTSFGGTMIVQGEVKGDIVAFNGSVLIGGLVEGNVTLYGGELTLQNSARVNGNIHVCGGQWIEGTESRLHGNVFDCTESVSLLLLGDGGPTFRFWSVLTWVALALLLTTLLPEHVMLVRTTLQYKKRRSLVLGLLSVLLAPVVMVILIALIIPIPLAIIVALGLLAAWALGTVAVGWSIGEYLLRIIAPQQHTRPIQVIVGSAVLALAGSLPYIGWAISLAAGLVGLGAVLLSRFGTRLYAPPKQPLLL